MVIYENFSSILSSQKYKNKYFSGFRIQLQTHRTCNEINDKKKKHTQEPKEQLKQESVRKKEH